MNYKILKDGEVINTIVADESFVAEYCAENGYTFEKIVDNTPEKPASTPTSVWDELDAAYAAGYQEGVDSV